MLINIWKINRNWTVFKGTFLILLVILPLTILSGSNDSYYNDTDSQQGISNESLIEDMTFKIDEEKNFVGNYSFDPESMLQYVDELYDETDAIFFESIGGFSTSIATFEALSILRIFGLDYYQFGAEWENIEVAIADKLIVDLKDEESGGFLIATEATTPSVEGTFGVVNTLWVMDEITLKLKPNVEGILDFLISNTFDQENHGFKEVNHEPNLKTTFQALSIIETSYKPVFNEFDETTSENINKTILEFMTNYSVDIFNFINSSIVDNTYFFDGNPYRSPIEDTWYAIKSINILEYFNTILGSNLPKKTVDYRDPVKNWLQTLVKNNGQTKGGYGVSEEATLKETGLTYILSDLLNITNEIDDAEALLFVNSSQFLKRENRTYLASENVHLGGYGPNNISFSNSDQNHQISVHNTYYASLAYLFSSSIFEAMDPNLETSYYQSNPEINISNYIIQGEISSLEMNFPTYNYEPHGSLSLTMEIDNWDLDYISYNERNPVFYGKSVAKYKVNILNDSSQNYNWTLGTHDISINLSVRKLPVFDSPNYTLNSTITVGYAPKYHLVPSLIKPGTTLNATVYYQNRSTISYSPVNITEGNLTTNLTSPNNQVTEILTFEPVNMTIEAFYFNIAFSNESLLGTWKLFLSFNISNFVVEINIDLDLSDEINFVNIESEEYFYPGDQMNINITLEYSNGNFTKYANASLAFTSNETDTEVFLLRLSHISGNNYSSLNENCPLRLLTGFYNVSIKLYWNTTNGYQESIVKNESLTTVEIKGIPIIVNSAIETKYRSLEPSTENLIYYGESFNISFNVGFNTPSGLVNMTVDSSTDILGGIVNNSQEESFLQSFDFKNDNESFYLGAYVNPNLFASTYGTRFKIKSEWNNSFIFLRNFDNISRNMNYNITLTGEFSIVNTTYYTTDMDTQNEYYVYAKDSASVISISFNIINTAFNNIPVPFLDLYGILDYEGNPGDLNQLLPGITSAFDENNSHINLLSIPPSGLDAKTYEIRVFTSSSIHPDYFVGLLSPGFKIISTFNPDPLITIPELFILVMLIIFFSLIYLNLKRYR
ncbi:MAG: hypothetical protein ACW99F_02875 [Candidatus Hodarchaeales archaeon]